MAEVEVFGPCSWNQIVRLTALPEPRPHTAFATGCYDTVGGTSAGKALHLVDRGRTVHLHTVVGDDEHGRRIVAALAGAGVALESTVVGGPSERHLNLMTERGERVSIYLSLPADPPAIPRDRLLAHLGDARALVVDLASWTRRDLPMLRDLAQLDIPIWTDLHDDDGQSDFRAPFRSAAAYQFMNADGLPAPLPFLHRLIDGGARAAVCTLGARGALAVDADHREHRVPAAEIAEIVDTNGAGDAFFAGFLDATLGGADTPEALTAGAEQAIRALSGPHLSPLLGAD